MTDVSVIVRAKDEAASIGRVLELLAAQELGGRTLETIVVDSGSVDRTVELARAAGAQVVEIAAESFTFGGALNTGCEAASGEILVALSAHAFPPDAGWLARLLEPFADPRVACACGDRYAPDGGPLTTRVVQDAELLRRRPHWGYTNGAGAFRADLWRELPFRADLPGTEDKAWAGHWIERGLVCVVDPSLVVEHDHSHDPPRAQFLRARREWEGSALYLGLPPRSARSVAREWWTERESFRSTARARLSPRRLARLLGMYAGLRRDPPDERPALPGIARSEGRSRIAVIVDRFPELTETFVLGEVRALRRLGHEVSVEASLPASHPALDPVGDLDVAYARDEKRAERLGALAGLVARHPARCAADLLARRRWAREEPVAPLRRLAVRARRVEARRVDYVHAHFAIGAALDAMRIAALTGRPWGFTAHGYDVYERPANLPEKLRRADLPVTVCDYCVRDLERIGGRPVAKVVMGVDPAAFRRTAPHPGGRRVVAVGRLVEKKGFAYLIEAAALLARGGTPLDRVTIVGEGPLRPELAALARERGLAETVDLAGAASPAEVRAFLEAADALVAPSVIAADGDRDSMPVVVKEALAMEVPVVASDEAGLPEIVRPEWGALAAPGDPAALAAAIGSVLDRPAAERAAMGRAGRAHVEEHASVEIETARLAERIAALRRR